MIRTMIFEFLTLAAFLLILLVIFSGLGLII
jgi:hypothetical protein